MTTEESSSEKDVVLLVDPDPASMETFHRSLADSKLEAVEATSVAEALDLAVKLQPRLVLSELVLPDGSGFALCRRLRSSSSLEQVPVVFVSRWSMEPDRILAFECGADDFIAKPFFTRELSSRIQAVLRRSAAPGESGQSAIPSPDDDALVIHFDHGEVQVAGERVPLTPREFSLFAALVRRRGRVMSRRELIEQAWGEGDGPNTRSVDAHVKSLRRKLGRARHAVETVRGLGYRFTDRCLSPTSSL